VFSLVDVPKAPFANDFLLLVELYLLRIVEALSFIVVIDDLLVPQEA
jgi:hypothetical protein